jgi:hypothetical protein
MGMNENLKTLMHDRRVLAGLGAGAALIAGIAIAVAFSGKGAPAPEGQRGALQVEMGPEEAKLDPSRPLRCFVGGQFVGLETLASCARKNGVAAQNLDVGLDQSGALAAAGAGQTALQPLPPELMNPPTLAIPAPGPQPQQQAQAAPPSAPAPVAECLRYGDSGWRSTGNASLNACVQTLFDGRCVRPGEAVYGRWGSQSLRLVTGKVEASPDNRSFHTLAEQSPRDCSIPPV